MVDKIQFMAMAGKFQFLFKQKQGSCSVIQLSDSAGSSFEDLDHCTFLLSWKLFDKMSRYCSFSALILEDLSVPTVHYEILEALCSQRKAGLLTVLLTTHFK